MASKQDMEKFSALLNRAKKGKGENDDAPAPKSSQSESGATAMKERSRPSPTDKNKTSKKKPATNDKNKDSQGTNRTEDVIELKELKRFLTDDDGIKVFRKNYTKLLNDDMTVKEYPDLLKGLPSLPDLEPVIKKHFAKGKGSPLSFHTQLQSMLDRVDASSRHDFSLMLPQYVRVAIDTIAEAGNSMVYKNYPSLVDLKKRYGDGKITRSSLLFAILGGEFHPDVGLQKRFLGEILGRYRRKSQAIMKDLLRSRTLTPNNYEWSGRDTTTFNFPNNFGSVITIAIVKYLITSSGFLTNPSLQKLIKKDSRDFPSSKSLSKNSIYQDLQQYLNLRLVINTKLQHVLFDGIKSHTANDVKR